MPTPAEIVPHPHEPTGEWQDSLLGCGYAYDSCKICGLYPDHPIHQMPLPDAPRTDT